VEHGIDSISVSPDSFLAVKKVVNQAEQNFTKRPTRAR
jgi:phosphoenolpyruvate synthase/pyruvate phosphate dikinase